MKQTMHLPENAPLLCELALIVMIAWVVSGWLLPTDMLKPFGTSQKTVATATTLPNITELLAVPLFGKVRSQIQPSKPVVQKPMTVLPSRLNIKLLGTVVAGKNSAAIIAVANKHEQRVFIIGDRIQPGVILREVQAQAIVVEHGGKLERISLEQGAKPITMAMPGTGISTRPGQARIQTTNTPMNRARLQQQLNNFPALLSQARVIPRMVDGKPGGFIISDIAPGSLYQQAGLQNGDIILSVNGEKITGAKQAMHMYETLKKAASIDLELMRAGQHRQIHYDIH